MPLSPRSQIGMRTGASIASEWKDASDVSTRIWDLEVISHDFMDVAALIALGTDFAYENQRLFRLQLCSALVRESFQAEIVKRVFDFFFCRELFHCLGIDHQHSTRFESADLAQQEIRESSTLPVPSLGAPTDMVEKLRSGYRQGVNIGEMGVPLVGPSAS